jgi:hypothetical protein
VQKDVSGWCTIFPRGNKEPCQDHALETCSEPPPQSSRLSEYIRLMLVAYRANGSPTPPLTIFGMERRIWEEQFELGRDSLLNGFISRNWLPKNQVILANELKYVTSGGCQAKWSVIVSRPVDRVGYQLCKV